MRWECLFGHIGTMWTLVVLCLVSTAVSENVESRKSLPIDATANALPLSSSVNNVLDQRPSTFESTPTAQIQNILPTTPFGDVSLMDLSKYIGNTAVPGSNGLAPNVNKNVPDLTRYSPILPASNKPLLLHTQNPELGLQQSILAIPYIQPQKVVNCDNSEVLIKIWMILSNLLKSTATPANTYMDQIKYALILIKSYLQNTNTGQNNELMWRLMLLESELDKGKHPGFDNQRAFNINQPTLPIQNDNVPKLRLQYEIPPNMNSKCQEAFMKLIQWAQEAYGNLIRGQCGFSAVDSSLGYQGSITPVPASYNFGNNSYLQLPYVYKLLGQNPQYTASYYSQSPGILEPAVNQQLQNSGTNAIFNLENNFPTISQPNQEQHNTASNPFAQTLGSLYNPVINQNPLQFAASNVDQKSVLRNPVHHLLEQTKNLKHINPSLLQLPPNLFQWNGSLNLSYPDTTVNGGNFFNRQLPFQGNFATNLQYLTGQIFTDNLQQQVKPLTYTRPSIIGPNNPTYDATKISGAVNVVNGPGQQLGAGAMQQIMHNVPVSNGFYENIQQYLNSQSSAFSQNNWNTPQKYGTYSKIFYQSFPYTNNINQPSIYTTDQYDPTRNNLYSLNQNLNQISSSQQTVPAIDWNGLANESKANSGTTLTGEVELTYALKNPTPGLQPLYFVKYRLPYDVFMQNVRSLLSTRSGKTDLSKDLVLKSNVSEVPQDLATYPKEEVRDLVVREGDLIKARYIEGNRTNDKDTSAADSINALLDKAMNPVGNVNAENDVTHTVARNINAANPFEYRISPTGQILQIPVNTYQYQQSQGLYQNGHSLQQGPNNFGINYHPGSPPQNPWNAPVPQTGVGNSYNSVNPSL